MRRPFSNRTGNRGRLPLLITLLSLLSAAPAVAEKRIALVVGNSAYQNVTRLDNPAQRCGADGRDARRTSASPSSEDAPSSISTSPRWTHAVQNFGRQVQGADVALFYYAGHGVQVSGSNYLVPVNANPTREADVDFQMVDINLVLRQMQGSGTRLNLVILDACRNNPFGGRGLRASEGGLAQMRAPEGTLISYATQPGSVAQDGSDGHSPYTKALGDDHQTSGARHLSNLQPGRPRGETGDRRIAAAVGVVVADRRHLLFCCARCGGAARQQLRRRHALTDTLRPDPDFVPIKDGTLLRELSERLYEHNFDPEPPDSKNGMKLAIAKFQEKSSMAPSGEATEGVLMRLRKMEDLKPWGSIVYGPDSDKWGISWNHTSRRAAVEDARSKCGASKCPIELSFYGTGCGAFAISGKSWSLVQRDTVQRAKDAALDECSRTDKSCRIIGAVCADGSGR